MVPLTVISFVIAAAAIIAIVFGGYLLAQRLLGRAASVQLPRLRRSAPS